MLRLQVLVQKLACSGDEVSVAQLHALHTAHPLLRSCCTCLPTDTLSRWLPLLPHEACEPLGHTRAPCMQVFVHELARTGNEPSEPLLLALTAPSTKFQRVFRQRDPNSPRAGRRKAGIEVPQAVAGDAQPSEEQYRWGANSCA